MGPAQSKKIINFVLLFIFTAFMVGVSNEAIASKTDGAREVGGVKLDRISVAYCVDCVPFHFQDNQGNAAGIIIDLWRLWSQKTGTAIDFRAAPWDDSLAMVGSGAADAHAGLFYNKERDKFLDYGAALRKTDTQVFIHKGLPIISRLEDLSAYRIGVLAKDYVEGYLKKRLPKADVVPYPDYASIMAALKDGTLKVFAADTPTGIYHLQRSGLVESFSFSKNLLLYQNDWFAAVQEGNAALIKTINMGMSLISPSEKTEIGRRWAGIAKEEKTDALLISMDRDYAPMTFLNAQGKPAGFIVDLWRLWSGKIGQPIRFKENNWNESLKALRNGEADIHAGLFTNDELDQRLNFAPEVYRIETGLYHLVGSSVADDLAQLGKQTLGIITGSHQETMVRTRWPDLQLSQFDTPQRLIQALLKKKVVAIIAEVPVIDVLLDQMGLHGEVIHKPGRLFVNTLHPAVLKENQDLLAQIEQGFARISRLELGVLEKRWISNPENRIYASKIQLGRKAVPLNLTQEEKKWLASHPVIRMGVDRSWPPFEYLDDLDRHKGIAADFLHLIEARLGIRFASPPNISWDDVIAKTKQNELDMLSVLSPTKEREKFLNFTEPYLQAPFVIVRRIGSSQVSELKDLKGQKVGVVSGYAVEERLRKDVPFLELAPAKDFKQGLLALSTGTTDAFVGNLPSVNHFIQELFLNNLEVSASAGFTLDLAIGVRKDWPVFTEILNKAVRSVSEEDRRKMLRIEPKAKFKAQEFEASLLQIIMGAALLTLVLIIAVLTINRYLKTARAKGLTEDLFQSPKVRRVGVGIIGLFLAATIILSWIAINHIDQRIRQDMEVTLGNILKSSQASLRIWVGNNKKSVAQLLIESKLLKSVETLLKVPRNSDELAKNSAQGNVREFFDSRLHTSNNEGFLVIAPDLFIISAHRDIEIRSLNHITPQHKDLMNKAMQGELVFIPPFNSYLTFEDVSGTTKESIPEMLFVGPLRNTKGEVIAVVALRIDPSREFTQLAQGGRLGESGDTYAFNQQGYILTESRFEGQLEKLGLVPQGQKEILTMRVSDPGGNLVTGFLGSPSLKNRPLTLMAQSATTGRAETNTQGYRDYRGVPVLGSWLWDDVVGMGLATEIDLEEALEPYYSVRNIIVLVLSVIVIFSLVLTALSAWIGEQANLVLRKARDDLEQRVEDRTLELQSSEEKTRSIIDNSLDGIITIDDSGIIQLGNPALENIFGYQVSELVGKNISMLMPEPYKSEHDSYLEKFLKTGVANILGFTRELDGVQKKGTLLPIDLQISEMTLGEKKYFIGRIRDITERKNAEKELKQAKHNAEAANQAKSDFLANMSHEIRTPMNAIIGMNQLALKQDLNPKLQNYLSKTQTSANALLSIIDDILDFSKIEAGKLDMEKKDFSLDEVLGNLSNLVTINAKEKGLKVMLSVDTKVPCALVGDPRRLGQILDNLTNNAVKFTEQGEIKIEVQCLEDKSEQVELKFLVKDTGIGLTKEQIDNLFKTFNQADSSTTRKYGGAGLGLSICNSLVERMDGKIWVESEPGKGSDFIFTAKFGKGVDQKESTLTAAEDINAIEDLEKIRGAHVLLAEDDEINQEIAVELLEDVGLKVDVANNGKEAVEMAERTQYACILMDMQMPEMDGFEATRVLRKEGRHKNLPIIAVTANVMTGDREKCIAVGMNDHLAKPINAKKLYGALVKWIHPQEKNELHFEVEKKPAFHESLAKDSEDKMKPLPSEMPGLDIQAGLAIVSGKEKLYRKLLGKFERDYSHSAEIIRKAWENGELKEAERQAHTVKGVAASIGAKSLSDSAEEIESAIRNNNGLNKDELLIQFDQDLKQLLESLKELNLIKTEMAVTEKNVASTDPKILLEALSNIQPHVKSRKPKKCTHALDDILKLNWPDEFVGEIDVLKELLGKYKYNDAVKVLDSLTQKFDKKDVASVDPKILLEALSNLQPHVKSRKPRKCAPALNDVLNFNWPDKFTDEIDVLKVLLEKYNYKDALKILDSLTQKLED
jgi:PAS domain S-box-containing protein